jgi:hypothetical protein
LTTLPLPLALASRLLRPLAAPAAFLARRALFLPRRDARALLELAHFLFHESPRLLLLFVAQLVMAAIRAAPPSLGIGAFA